MGTQGKKNLGWFSGIWLGWTNKATTGWGRTGEGQGLGEAGRTGLGRRDDQVTRGISSTWRAGQRVLCTQVTQCMCPFHSCKSHPTPLRKQRKSSKDWEGGNWNDTVVFPTIPLLQQTPLPPEEIHFSHQTQEWTFGGADLVWNEKPHKYYMMMWWGPLSPGWEVPSSEDTERLPWQTSGQDSVFPLQGHGFNPWLGNKDLACCMALLKRPKKQRKKWWHKEKIEKYENKKSCRAKKKDELKTTKIH